MINIRKCAYNSFIKRTIVLLFICVGFGYIVSYTINSKLPRNRNEHQNKIDKIKELIEKNPENTKMQIILDEVLRLGTESTYIRRPEIARNLLIGTSTLNDSTVAKQSKDSKRKLVVVSNEIKIVAYFPRQKRLSHEIDLVDMSVCAASNCNIYRMSAQINGTILDADAVIFQGNRMPAHLPSRRDFDQVFVFLNNEPPLWAQLTNISEKIFTNYFNWTMTYRSDSDIPFLYGAITKKDAHFDDYVNEKERKKRNKVYFKKDLKKNYTAIYRAKDKNVFWIVSHCETKSKREDYVTKMREHIDIDQFGNCSQNKIGRETYFSTEIWTHYKFYLAYENTYCVDYLTEKVYNWFELDIILVVRGGCDCTKFLPNGTYVNADNFENAAALSNYLNKLGNDESEFINILKRKDEYRVYKEREMVQSSFCDLCEKLNNVDDHIKSVENIYDWWQKYACWETKNPS